MAPRHLTHFVVVGAGAAGLMAACELARAGRKVTILEARDRCGGRICPLSAEEFGYAAEGGPEFVHGAAPVTRAVMHEAGLSLSPRGGTRWSVQSGTLSRADPAMPHAARFYQHLEAVKTDLPIAEFLAMHFAGRQYDALRRSVTRTVEGYDAADPHRFSTLALREEWMARDDGEHGRLTKGYGALIEYLAAECRRHAAVIHLGAAVTAIAESGDGIAVHCRGGAVFEGDAAILTVPLPLLTELMLPAAAHARAVTAAADIGYGNVVKILLRFATAWWSDLGGRDLCGSVLSAVGSSGPDLVDAISRRLSGADRLAGWPQGRPGGLAHPSRPCRTGGHLARREFRPASRPHQKEPGCVARPQLGQRRLRTRRLFLRHPKIPRRAIPAETIGRRRRVLLRRGALCRTGHGHGRSGTGERPGNRAGHSGSFFS